MTRVRDRERGTEQNWNIEKQKQQKYFTVHVYDAGQLSRASFTFSSRQTVRYDVIALSLWRECSAHEVKWFIVKVGWFESMYWAEV